MKFGCTIMFMHASLLSKVAACDSWQLLFMKAQWKVHQPNILIISLYIIYVIKLDTPEPARK